MLKNRMDFLFFNVVLNSPVFPPPCGIPLPPRTAWIVTSGMLFEIDAIARAASFGDLLPGTPGCEYKASGNGAPIIGNAILHVQRHGAHVRDLFHSPERDGYAE